MLLYAHVLLLQQAPKAAVVPCSSSGATFFGGPQGGALEGTSGAPRKSAGFTPMLDHAAAPSPILFTSQLLEEQQQQQQPKGFVFTVPSSDTQDQQKLQQQQQEEAGMSLSCPDVSLGRPVGAVYMFGSGELEQIPFFSPEEEGGGEVTVPRLIPLKQKEKQQQQQQQQVVRAYSGALHTILLLADGRCCSFGCNDEGALGRHCKDVAPNEPGRGTLLTML